MNRFYYYMTVAELQNLETEHGVPEFIVNRDWETLTVSIDGTHCILETIQEIGLGYVPMTEIQARNTRNSVTFENIEQV